MTQGVTRLVLQVGATDMLYDPFTMCWRSRPCFGRELKMKKRSPQAAGILIALGAILGFVWGLLHRQANWWTLVGTLVGAALALLLWLSERRR